MEQYEQRGLTLIGLLVTVCVIIFSLFIFFLLIPIAPTRKIAKRVICGTNLKGLGTAITVYSNDYDGRFPKLPGEGPWSKELGFDYNLKEPDFEGLQKNKPRTITASWYLLVREADVSPKSFVCPCSDQTEWDQITAPPGTSNPPDLVEVWDFGNKPHQHVSYAMHNPYGKYPANQTFNANFAVAADMNPWMKAGDFISTPNKKNYPQIITAGDEATYKYGNSLNHPNAKKNFWGRYRNIKGTTEGQNVLFADGHASFEKWPNCGVNKDNIYTYWSTKWNPTEQDIQGGKPPTARDENNDAKSPDDSFLVL